MKNKKILICDDEEGIRESLKLILSDFYEVIAVDNGEACLDVLKNTGANIGLVMMDIKMPKAHGLEVLPQIKTKHPGVPVIMVTGYRSVETAAEATRLGASGYIVKPFKSEEILEKVKKNWE